MNEKDRDEEIDRALEAMARDTLDQCRIPDRMDGRSYELKLTPEMEADGSFVDVARAAAANGRASIVPWLWDRYCDGKALSDAQNEVAKRLYARAVKARSERAARLQAEAEKAESKRVGADLAAGVERDD